MSTPTSTGIPKTPWFSIIKEDESQKEPVYIDTAIGAVLEGLSKDCAIRANQNMNPRKRKKSKAMPRAKESSPEPTTDVQVEISADTFTKMSAIMDAASQKES
jgi:hypothetical protein